MKFREDESDDVVEEIVNPDGSVRSLTRKSTADIQAVKVKQYQVGVVL